ncbi:hypothetical protein GUITHDRAFT_105719 [Guillardia theta CCMP2712]|uniref:Uncharacterized protein n=1 Tax=Guillardia theta (strain CCMP2712) TaxID=905079 RepID=L1JJ71_GUITC|nr:hypothetical protein GUITHDRAFT_105719 [Guillardia theta CCMP2712]EKX48573.1 hypothetical protein GUITHDRAFT_105719 [Guillardia theta CCMP2712]|eukprot:XP_005835553.1 hypothetical protein GUITHDRAFT_105719 [Guillardia theta CCMP2712]
MSCLTALSGATGPTGGQKNGGPVDSKCDVKVGKDGELQIVRIDQKDDGVFKKPVPPGPRTALRQKALDEDVYTSSLKAIIERDYFPELPYLRAKQELDDAMQSRDPVRIKEAYANLRKCAMTPSGRYLSTPKRGLGASASSTPLGGTGRVSAPGTPGNRGRSSTPMGFDGDDHSVCLTNEDDLEREEEINRVIKGRSLDDFVKKYTSEDNKSASELMLKDAVAMEDRRMWIHEQAAEYNMRQKLLIERGPRQEDGTLNMILGAPYDEKDSLTSYVPSTHYIPKTKLPMGKNNISSSATRMARAGPQQDKTSLQPTFRAYATPGAESVAASPRVGGYSFLLTPSPAPGEQDDIPSFTWGNIEGTPLILPEDDMPEYQPFRVQERSKKEEVADSIFNKYLAKKALRAKGGIDAKARTPSRAAARRLASKSSGSRMGLPLDMQLRSTYRGTPTSSRLQTPRNSHASASGSSTPRSLLAPSPARSTSQLVKDTVNKVCSKVEKGTNLTDGLLQI